MKVVDFDGAVLDATFSVRTSDGGAITIVYESSGGREGGPNPRNLDYRRGLTVLLTRLRQMNAVIAEIRVETERTRMLAVDQQRVRIDGRSFPLALRTVGDVEQLRKEISRFGRRVGQDADRLTRPGGSSRRLRFFVKNVPLEQEILESQLQGEGAELESAVVNAVVDSAAGRTRSRGQGFMVSQAVKVAVERYAVSWAIRYYESAGWSVTDVGAVEPFDLRCERAGEELHVEVKGTTTSGHQVILTPNEVSHATRQSAMELFLVTEIEIDHAESGRPSASGGRAQVRPAWSPEAERLMPLGFFYSTGLDNSDLRQDWRSLS